MRHHLIPVVIIASVCTILYANTLNSPFVYDDFPNIVDNTHIRISAFDLHSILDSGHRSPSHRRPIANISFAINYLFGKYDVRGYHIVNIIVHIINAILVYSFSIVLLRDTACIRKAAGTLHSSDQIQFTPIGFIPLLAALIFAAHPIQIQSVTYIVQRMNSLSVMFYLLSFLGYRFGRMNTIKWQRHGLWIAAGLSWALALGTKEIAVTLPIVICLYEWLVIQDLRIDWLRKHYLYIAGLICLSVLVTYAVLDGTLFYRITNSYVGRDFDMSQRVMTQSRVIILYLSLLLFPHPSRLNLLHPITTSQSLISPITTLFSIAAILLLIAGAIICTKRSRLFSFCIFWFFINLAVESSIIGLEMIYEHRLYLPMVGVSLLAAHCFYRLLGRNRLWTVVMCLSIVASLGAATYARNHIWSDSAKLWEDVILKFPDSDRAHNNLGTILKARGNLDKAVYHYQEALRIRPGNANAHNNMGVIYEKQGRLKEAVDHYVTALSIRPTYPEAHNNLGVTLERLGQYRKAIDHFLEALRMKPEYVEAYINLGTTLTQQGNLKAAIAAFTSALDIQPLNAGIYNNLGIAFEREGKINEAGLHYKRAIEIDPDYGEAYNNLGISLAKQGLYQRAIHNFSQSLRISPGNEGTKQNLALTRELQRTGLEDGGPEVGGRRSEDGDQKTENGGRRARGRRSEIRGRRTEGGK